MSQFARAGRRFEMYWRKLISAGAIPKMIRLRKVTRGVAAATTFTLVGLLGIPAGLTMAQESGGKLEEIIVIESPIALRHKGWTTGGLPIHVFELTRRISYADLDLSAAADQAVLRERIASAARMSCEELADAYPIDFWGRKATPRCIDKAVKRSEKQVLAAITAQQTAKAAAHY